MAARKRKTSRRKAKAKSGRPRKRDRGGFVQRALVALSGMVLVLCAASITNGFFIRGGGGDRHSLRVEVLNGTGVQGLAHRAKRGLHRRGVDVIGVRNAGHFDYEESILIARRQGAEVRKLADMLGCRHVVVQLQEDALEDATLILGQDYESLRLGWELESDLLE